MKGVSTFAPTGTLPRLHDALSVARPRPPAPRTTSLSLRLRPTQTLHTTARPAQPSPPESTPCKSFSTPGGDAIAVHDLERWPCIASPPGHLVLADALAPRALLRPPCRFGALSGRPWPEPLGRPTWPGPSRSLFSGPRPLTIIRRNTPPALPGLHAYAQLAGPFLMYCSAIHHTSLS